MPPKLSIFTKINLLILFLIVPVIILNAYSTNVSNTVIREEVELINVSHLSFLSNEISTSIDQLSTYAMTLIRDDTVREFIIPAYMNNPYRKVKTYLNLEQKLSLNAASTAWRHHISVYSPWTQAAVSENGAIDYDKEALKRRFSSQWNFIAQADGNGYFIRHFLENETAKSGVTEHNAVVEVTFPSDDLIHMLDEYKSEGSGDPLFFSPDRKLSITNSTSDRQLSNHLVSKLDSKQLLKDSGSDTVSLDGKKYLITFHRSPSIGWFLADYVPLAEITAPIARSLQIFYFSVGVLLTLAFSASYLFYRNVQLPIRYLISGVRAITRGDYSVRVARPSHFEFLFLFDQFNNMAQQIQQLIKTVYQDQILLHESKLKLLQSQIDPHFLYNCLFFIKNQARMGDEESVVKMALNLGNYYRYSTRLDKPHTSLKEELNLIESYLNIHNLRLNRIRYEIDVPREMLELQIPRLFLQPIVENAVIHGIEQQYDPGFIRITGTVNQNQYAIVVEDSGVGLNREKLTELQKIIEMPINEGKSYGLWNVRQRLMLHFGNDAYLFCEPCELGGLKVNLTWQDQIGG